MLMAIPSIGALHCTAPLYILPNTFGLRLFLLYQAPLSPSWVIHWHNQWIPILLFSLHDFFFFITQKPQFSCSALIIPDTYIITKHYVQFIFRHIFKVLWWKYISYAPTKTRCLFTWKYEKYTGYVLRGK